MNTVLGDALRLWMAANRITCRQLAREVGISAATVNRICNGGEMDWNSALKMFAYITKPRGAK